MERLIDYLLAGLRGVLRHKTRSALAVSGIVLAISAFLSMLAVGEGARKQILKDMEHLGLRNIIVTSKRQAAKEKKAGANENEIETYGLTRKDMTRCKELIPGLVRAHAIHEVRSPVRINARPVNAKVIGVNCDYFKTRSMRVDSGRMLCAMDGERNVPACILVAPVPSEIRRGEDPLKLDVVIGAYAFNIVGVASSESELLPEEHQSDQGGAKGNESASNFVTIFIPFETAISLFGTTSVKQSAVSYEIFKVELDQIILDCDDPLLALKPLEQILRLGHKEVDYEITVPLEVLRQRQRTQDIFNLVLLLVAGITLLVGGVGIVNIMLVSVTERTKEIGIRRALGARQSEIVIQFLIETLALTMTGGSIGILLGFGGIYAVQRYTGWPVAVTTTAIAGSFFLSIISGVLFGLYPARKAAAVMPMIALRYE